MKKIFQYNNLSSLMKPSNINKKKSIPRHVIMKLQNSKDKVILKEARGGKKDRLLSKE